MKRTKDWTHLWLFTPFRTLSHWNYKATLRALIDFENAKKENALEQLQEELNKL